MDRRDDYQRAPGGATLGEIAGMLKFLICVPLACIGTSVSRIKQWLSLEFNKPASDELWELCSRHNIPFNCLILYSAGCIGWFFIFSDPSDQMRVPALILKFGFQNIFLATVVYWCALRSLKKRIQGENEAQAIERMNPIIKVICLNWSAGMALLTYLIALLVSLTVGSA
jgi:hypothetical protein